MNKKRVFEEFNLSFESWKGAFKEIKRKSKKYFFEEEFYHDIDWLMDKELNLFESLVKMRHKLSRDTDQKKYSLKNTLNDLEADFNKVKKAVNLQ